VTRDLLRWNFMVWRDLGSPIPKTGESLIISCYQSPVLVFGVQLRERFLSIFSNDDATPFYKSHYRHTSSILKDRK
jgi:hypothetical protein